MMPASVPLPGLIHWCVEGPLIVLDKKDISAAEIAERRTLDSRLHLAVLETMLETEKLLDRMVQKDVVLVRDFAVICENVLLLIKNLDYLQFQDAIQLSLDRLGQALQVCVRTGCLRGSIGKQNVYYSYLVEVEITSLSHHITEVLSILFQRPFLVLFKSLFS